MNTHVVPIIQVLIEHLTDSITFCNLSQTCKSANRICNKYINNLSFKHGLSSKNINKYHTTYQIYQDDICIFETTIHNKSGKKNGTTKIIVNGYFPLRYARFNYKFGQLHGQCINSRGTEFWMKNNKKIGRYFRLFEVDKAPELLDYYDLRQFD